MTNKTKNWTKEQITQFEAGFKYGVNKAIETSQRKTNELLQRRSAMYYKMKIAEKEFGEAPMEAFVLDTIDKQISQVNGVTNALKNILEEKEINEVVEKSVSKVTASILNVK